ncbi:DUF4405 domain-containing protein [Dawidia soli]|uniref:DUF4405 domain-containing protein n=1 Tax=Dawidia soli TaxID=2782352 RepID=A0AAP2D9A8_9BACT|nr:DUF4405 domain-containing protein [Dawidia soli]MBT1684987.1 DUF4405 domain-containing protein [Dawidia soli]
MKLSRNYITPFISLVFLVVGLSGLLMLFHLFDGYTEVVHECLGVFFVICAIFHVILNWSALKIHFRRGIFLPALAGAVTLTVALVILESMHPPVDMLIINRIIKAPMNDAFKALEVEYSEAAKRLKANGISIENARTIEDIWVNSNADPEKVIDLITE